MPRGENSKVGESKKSYNVSKQELKKILLDFLVDGRGQKLTKNKLCKNRKFLKKIKWSKKTMLPSTISNWCRRLNNIEPLGEITEEFLFDYHKQVTGKIGKNVKFSDFCKPLHNKMIQGKNYVNKEMYKQFNIDERKILMILLKIQLPDIQEEDYDKIGTKDLKELVKLYYLTEEEYYKKLSEVKNWIFTGDKNLLNYL